MKHSKPKPDARRTLYPAIRPYRKGFLRVSELHEIYFEESGNRGGKPVIFLHGGPGGGTEGRMRRFFDPKRYRIVLFDQRGCGKSRPHASLVDNTTWHLVEDIERLREHLGIERWLVFGSSWGVTLGLAYAQRHPARVTQMVLAAVTMTRPIDIHWLYHTTGRFFPEAWQRFRNGVPERDRNGDLVSAYYRLLHEQPDLEKREQAARDWCAWEDAVVSLEDDWTPNPRYEDPAFRMTFARIVTHYFHHAAWLEDDQLLRDAHRLIGIPGVLIHGKMDIGGPPDVPWHLAAAWPDAELQLVRAGHSGAEMSARLIAATDRFAALQLRERSSRPPSGLV